MFSKLGNTRVSKVWFREVCSGVTPLDRACLREEGCVLLEILGFIFLFIWRCTPELERKHLYRKVSVFCVVYRLTLQILAVEVFRRVSNGYLLRRWIDMR